jgi:hypothetical protein
MVVLAEFGGEIVNARQHFFLTLAAMNGGMISGLAADHAVRKVTRKLATNLFSWRRGKIVSHVPAK